MNGFDLDIGNCILGTYCSLDDADVMEFSSHPERPALIGHPPAGIRYVRVNGSVDASGDNIAGLDHSQATPDESFDLVLASSFLEHDQFFWDSFVALAKKARVGGYIGLTAPSNGLVHRYPNDCWRLYPDAGSALAAWGRRQGLDVNLVESFMTNGQDDIRTDFVAIFRRGPLDAEQPNHFVHARLTGFNVKTWQTPDLVAAPAEIGIDPLVANGSDDSHVVRLAQKVAGQCLEVEWLRRALGTAHEELAQLRKAYQPGDGADFQPPASRGIMQTDCAFDMGIAVDEAEGLAKKGIGLKIESLNYGDISPDGAAIAGRDRFIFISGGSNAWSLQISGDVSISDDLLEQSVSDIASFDQNCAMRNIHNALIIIPEKDIIYPEFSPNCDGIEMGWRSVHRLQERCPNTIYPVEKLMAAKSDAVVYHRRDSHYNAFGGLIVVNEVLKAIGCRPIDYPEVPFAHREFQDDLAVKWEAYPTMRRIVPYDYTEEEIQKGDPLTGLHICLRSSVVKNNQTIIIFGDSYSWNIDAGLSRFMTRRFETVHFIWGRDINWSLVDRISPSAIVMQSAERFLVGGLVYRKAERAA